VLTAILLGQNDLISLETLAPERFQDGAISKHSTYETFKF